MSMEVCIEIKIISSILLVAHIGDLCSGTCFKTKTPILLKNGFIHTVSMGVIEGSILFENGKIVRVAKYISPPDNCEVIDLSGKHVYPGMIAAVSGIGLIEINAVSVTNDHSERGDFNPNVRTNVAYNPDSELIPTTRSNGVLVANVVPSSGLVSGQFNNDAGWVDMGRRNLTVSKRTAY